MNRRDSMLREFGLGPRWRLRAAPAERSSQPLPDALPALIETKPSASPVGVSPPLTLAMPAVTAGDHAAAVAAMDWVQLKAAVAACQTCGLARERTQAVLGVGDTQAEWLFVGEGPGAEEDQRGEPFVGQAGKLLDAMLAAIDLKRGDNVYIANAVKCRPPHNRTPEAEETAACWPYLERQIALLKPKLIVALGRPAAQTLLRSEVKISSSRGRLHDVNGIPLIVTYHPAYLLRNLPDKAKAWEDLCFMRRTMQQLKSDGVV